MQQNHAIAVIIIVLFVVITALSFGIYKLIQAGRAGGGTTTTTEESLADEDDGSIAPLLVPPATPRLVPPHAPRWRPPILPPSMNPQRVVPPSPPPPPALVHQHPTLRRSGPPSQVPLPPQPTIDLNVQPVPNAPQPPPSPPPPVVQRARPVARTPSQAPEMVQRPSRPVARQASISQVQQTRLSGVQRRKRSSLVIHATSASAVMADPPPVEMVQRASQPVVQRASASVIQGPREQTASTRTPSRPSALHSTASASQTMSVGRTEPHSRSRSSPVALSATASIIVQSPLRDHSVSSVEPDPIPLVPGRGPGPLPLAGLAVPGDLPANIHEPHIYHAHPTGPPRAPPVERHYPSPLNAFELDGGSVRRGAASITGTLPRHASQRARRARAAVFDYIGGTRFLGRRRVEGSGLNIFHAPAVPANSGPPRGPRPQPKRIPGTYSTLDDDDD